MNAPFKQNVAELPTHLCVNRSVSIEVEDRYVHPVMSPALQTVRARRTVTLTARFNRFADSPEKSRRTWLRKIHLSITGMAGVNDDIGHARRHNGPAVRVAIVTWAQTHRQLPSAT